MGLVQAATASATASAQISGLRMAFGPEQRAQGEVQLLSHRGRTLPRALPDPDGASRATPPSFPPPGRQWAERVAEQRVGGANAEDVDI